MDAAYSSDLNRVIAVATLFVDGHLEKTSIYTGRFTFPYVSGLFFLHEGPFVVAAVRKLEETPQLVCFDAHGLAHPRLKGLATVCGIVLGIPSIGIAKSVLVGEASSYRPRLQKIVFDGRCVGYITSETRKRYWSPGYSVSLNTLEEVIRQYGTVSMNALEESHRLACKIVAH
ncbi:MAG: endonuclease V [Nitrososphaerota archaeon]|nr:endonuclease V [Nitrososphaerota archaeon]